MNKAREIETLRLMLQLVKIEDTEEIAGVKSITIEKARSWILKILDPASNPTYVWAIHREGRVVGTICLWNIEGHKAELGYDIHDDYRKRGFAYEASEAVIDFAKGEGFDEIQAYCEKVNKPSLRILAKLGFEKTGAKGEFSIYRKEI